MSWTLKRETTREEDLAYCLLGIFGVRMWLSYCEGRNDAFERLNKKITRCREAGREAESPFGLTTSSFSQRPQRCYMRRMMITLFLWTTPTIKAGQTCML